MQRATIKKDAVIVIGQLRCWEDNRVFFEGLTRDFDVYIITDGEWRHLPDPGLFRVFIIDDYPQEKDRHTRYLALRPPEGRKMLQWSKLGFGLRCAQEAEARAGRTYARIFKLRSDLENCADLDMDRTLREGTFYCHTDYCFAAQRDLLLKLQPFCDRPEDYLDWYTPIDTSLPGFSGSDREAARFRWLPYPATLPFSLVGWSMARRLLPLRLNCKAPDSMTYRNHYPADGWRVGFGSEMFFLRFILELGAKVQGIGRNGARITLLKKRMAESDKFAHQKEVEREPVSKIV